MGRPKSTNMAGFTPYLGFKSSLVQDLYEVERIVGKKLSPDGIAMYQVKWKGYDSSKNTWEPIEHFSQAKDVLLEYERSLKAMKATSTIKKGRPAKKRHVRIHVRQIPTEKKRTERIRKSVEKEEKIVCEEEIGESDDVPQSILACVSPEEKDAEQRMFKVSWKKRKNGVTPRNSILAAKEIKSRFGYQILLDFYEKNFKC